MSKCSSAITEDKLNFGIACTKKLLDVHEIVVEYPSDIHRLTQDALQNAEEVNVNADLLVITNVNLLTMETGNLHGDVLHDVVLFSRAGKIDAIVGARDAVIPRGAAVIDAEGGDPEIHLVLCSFTYANSQGTSPRDSLMCMPIGTGSANYTLPTLGNCRRSWHMG